MYVYKCPTSICYSTISIGVILLIKVFLNTKEKLLEMNNNINKNAENFIDLNKRFITLEDLSDIRLDIRELKKKVFK